MSRAVLSIGSNLGDRLGALRAVVAGFGDRVTAVSPVYRTAPWGGVEQEDFLNAVLLADDPAYEPAAWLRHGAALEDAAGRVRAVHWGPRSLDVDVVWCGTAAGPVHSADPWLTLPHPQAHRRAFVLVPWLDVEPAAVLTADGATRPVREWLAALDPGERDGVHRTGDDLGAAGSR
ncbi:2-amino-4-hydroxy-6-hydroxymethyldihydropteridine diphosphokinase [Nocardia sp. NPDC057353]|uniref:2-amino-4-hydroxy-6- hydroxymethyldihydropteridine diphosphokinase n=1 Tax=Nocardia sp. NPDC057353 TaxID=3346104 RepID=UPI003625AB85